MQLNDRLYLYKAVLLSAYDGDTVRLDVDLGFGTWLKNQSVRLAYIDTPEVRGSERPEGIKSRDRLLELLPPNSNCFVETQKSKGKYGRWIGEIFLVNGVSINQTLLDEGLADRYEG